MYLPLHACTACTGTILSLFLSLSYFLMKLMMMVVVVASKDGLQLNVRSKSQWEPYTAIDIQFRLFTLIKKNESTRGSP